MVNASTLASIGISEKEYMAIVEAVRDLPPAKGEYLESDFVTNLQLTVLDYQLHNQIVARAFEHYRKRHWDTIRTLDDLKLFLSRFRDDRDGNTAAAKELWGYRYWNRFGQLRRLTEFFESVGVVNHESLKRWADQSSFNRDFKGKIRGLGQAVYRWALIRLGGETVKPDVHVKRFVAGVLGRPLNESRIVDLLELVARDLGKRAYEVDWAIWEHQRGAPGTR